MSPKEKVVRVLKDALNALGISQEHLNVEAAPAHTGADYATNIALAKAKEVNKNPKELAGEIVNAINNQGQEVKAEVAGSGFINLSFTGDFFAKALEKMTVKDLARSKALEGQKIIVEFTDPNPFKEFHIGHLYSNSVGESIARLLELQGAQVRRANYQGDVGLHVAKALWGMEQKLRDERIALEALEEQALQEKLAFLGKAYALGASAYEESENAKKEIQELNKKIYENILTTEYENILGTEYEKDASIGELYEKGRAWSLEGFEEMYKRLGTTFDVYYFEGDIAEKGMEIVREYKEKGVFEESKGAIIFPGEKHGLHTRVFINSKGLPTYETKELGLAFIKEEDFPADTSIIITGNEINQYFKVLLKALEEIHPALAKKTVHLSHGMVRMPEGKMSSRKGNVLTGKWLLNEAKTRAKKLMETSGHPLKGEKQEEVAEQVAVAAVKFALLKHALGGDIVFSLEDSVSFEGASGPYIQYTYARARSVVKKAGNTPKTINTELQEELPVARLLVQFSDFALNAARLYAPHILCNYLFSLAQAYNNFYSKHKIIGSKEEQTRLLLTQAVGDVLKTGLNVLGIEAPQAM